MIPVAQSTDRKKVPISIYDTQDFAQNQQEDDWQINIPPLRPALLFVDDKQKDKEDNRHDA